MNAYFLNTNGNWLALTLLALISFTNAQSVFGQEEIKIYNEALYKLPNKYYYLITPIEEDNSISTAELERLSRSFREYNFHQHNIRQTSYFSIGNNLALIVFTSKQSKYELGEKLAKNTFSKLQSSLDIPQISKLNPPK